MRCLRLVPFICLFGLPLVLGGCAGALVAGGLAAAGGAGYTAAQERGLVGNMEDFQIKTDIERAYADANPELAPGLSVTVYDSRVLLTGRVATPDMKAQAKQIAGMARGVRSVYDEIEVGPIETAWESAKNTWITARLRTELMTDPDVRSGNYTIQTAGQSIYLIGSARSQAELEKATRVARYIPDVKRVVSYVEIRSGLPFAGRPAPPLPYAAPSDRPTAAPRAPIAVEKL